MGTVDAQYVSFVSDVTAWSRRHDNVLRLLYSSRARLIVSGENVNYKVKFDSFCHYRLPSLVISLEPNGHRYAGHGTRSAPEAGAQFTCFLYFPARPVRARHVATQEVPAQVTSRTICRAAPGLEPDRFDSNRHEAAAVMMGIEQRKLLLATGPVGVVDVQHDPPRHHGVAVAEQVNHRRHHALEGDRTGQVLQPRQGRLRAGGFPRLGQAADRQIHPDFLRWIHSGMVCAFHPGELSARRVTRLHYPNRSRFTHLCYKTFITQRQPPPI